MIKDQEKGGLESKIRIIIYMKEKETKMDYLKRFLYQISKHKLIVIILSVGLVLIPAGTTLATETPDSKSISQTESSQTIQEATSAFDIATGWNVLEYSSSLGVPEENTFVQNRKIQAPNGNSYNSAYINFANIGDSVFKATRTFHLKAGNTYHFNWYYQLRIVRDATASISFNGNVKTADASNDQLLPTPYTETVVADKDEDYVVTIQYNARDYSNVLLSVGYEFGSPNVGVEIAKTQKEQGKVAVQYLDQDGKSIQASTELSGNIGDRYTVEVPRIPGYILQETSDNVMGTFQSSDQTVTLTYKKIQAVENGKVVVNFVDENGKSLTDSPEILTGEVGSSYAVKPKSFSGYRLTKLPDNQAGKFSNQTKEITFVYHKLETDEQGSGNKPVEPPTGSNDGKGENVNSGNGQAPNSKKPSTPSDNGAVSGHENSSKGGQTGSSTANVGLVAPPTPAKKEEVPQASLNQSKASLVSNVSMNNSGTEKSFNGKTLNQENPPAMSTLHKARMNAELPATGDKSPIAGGLLGLMLVLGSMYRFKK
ncbi:MucBP domain-containing protein [Listeria kieliensis]